ncbi:SemiSWEET transporter [bacterium]|nr:SemiSWEET transporter [bacterium]
MVATLTTVSFFPQALKTLKGRDTCAISLRMYLLFTAGVSFWSLYGWMVNDGLVLIANLITLVPAVIVLGLKLSSFRKQPSSSLRSIIIKR